MGADVGYVMKGVPAWTYRIERLPEDERRILRWYRDTDRSATRGEYCQVHGLDMPSVTRQFAKLIKAGLLIEDSGAVPRKVRAALVEI
jgi:hypothetical protein